MSDLEMCRRLSDRFHERVEQDPVLRPMFPKDLHRLSEWFTLFLAERMGGPATYTARRGRQSLVCRHAHLPISDAETGRWLAQMVAAMEEVGVPEPEAARLRRYFEETAQTLTDPYLPLYALPLDELRGRIEGDPELLRTSPAGHSLLRDAASRWDASRVLLLLELGADANGADRLGHGPLYWAVNARVPGAEAAGMEVVEALLAAGAEVNRRSGPGKVTALHVAARRGHVGFASLLVRVGADIWAMDSKRQTALQRAVNCRQRAMVAFLEALTK